MNSRKNLDVRVDCGMRTAHIVNFKKFQSEC